MLECLGLSVLKLYGIGLIAIGICAIQVKLGRFTKTTDAITEVTIIKDKRTGKEYIQHNGGNMTELK